jgi:hypothetical protein
MAIKKGTKGTERSLKDYHAVDVIHEKVCAWYKKKVETEELTSKEKNAIRDLARRIAEKL